MALPMVRTSPATHHQRCLRDSSWGNVRVPFPLATGPPTVAPDRPRILPQTPQKSKSKVCHTSRMVSAQRLEGQRTDHAQNRGNDRARDHRLEYSEHVTLRGWCQRNGELVPIPTEECAPGVTHEFNYCPLGGRRRKMQN